MKRLYLIITATIFTMLILSCSDTSLLSPSNNSGVKVDIQSIKSGDLLKPGSPVTFKVFYPPSEESQDGTIELDIKLENLETGSIDEKTVASPSLNEPVDLDLGQLESGLYRLTIIVLRDGETIDESSVDFFYVSGSYRVTDIQSFPPVIFPRAQVSLQAFLDIPEGSDPFLRWTQNGSVIAKGLLSEGLDKVNIEAPKSPGVYSIKVELFPYKPVENDDFNFASSISMTSEMYVSQNENGATFYSRIFFTAQPVDYGVAPKVSAQISRDNTNNLISPIGNPVPPQEEEPTGYLIKRGSGFKLSYGIIPVSGGSLLPFTISMNISLDENESGRNIITVLQQDSNTNTTIPFFKIFLDENGSIQASVLNSELKMINSFSGIKELPAGKINKLTLSILPEDSFLYIVWALNGYQTNQEKLATIPYQPEGNLSTVIGGENGFDGVISEIEVYYKDASGKNTIDSNVLYNFLKEKYGKRLILASGFDGVSIPDGFSLSGEWFIQPGYLILKPGSQAESATFSLGNKKIDITFGFTQKYANENEKAEKDKNDINSVTFDIVDVESDKTLFSIDSNGKLTNGKVTDEKTTLEAKGEIIEQTNHSGEKIIKVSLERGNDSDTLPGKNPGKILIRIINSDTNEQKDNQLLLLDYLTVIEEE